MTRAGGVQRFSKFVYDAAPSIDRVENKKKKRQQSREGETFLLSSFIRTVGTFLRWRLLTAHLHNPGLVVWQDRTDNKHSQRRREPKRWGGSGRQLLKANIKRGNAANNVTCNSAICAIEYVLLLTWQRQRADKTLHVCVNDSGKVLMRFCVLRVVRFVR